MKACSWFPWGILNQKNKDIKMAEEEPVEVEYRTAYRILSAWRSPLKTVTCRQTHLYMV